MDISAKAAADPDAVVTVEDLAAWESEHGALPAGAAVMMYSGWEARLSNDPSSFVNQDGPGVPHFPRLLAPSRPFFG